MRGQVQHCGCVSISNPHLAFAFHEGEASNDSAVKEKIPLSSRGFVNDEVANPEFWR